jgi:dipeptidyl aminopeptidase/acylaminoacyl peptidase
MFVVIPDGEGPFPTVLNIHGGPEWHERDRFDPETQAFVDAGYAVGIVNYRGSTGYGVAFREALIGRVCLTESEDILACLDALVADGTTDPAHVYWNGWSWGGCWRASRRRAPRPLPRDLRGIPPATSSPRTGPPAPKLQA